MASEKVVLDASVVAKWYLREKYSEQALKLRDEYVSGRIAIAVPALLEYEVLNALKYSGAYSELELMDVARSLNKYGFEYWRLKGKLKDETIKIANKYDLTIYDASYLALCTIMKTKFYTSDEELLSKIAELKIAKHLKEVAKES
ncbi:MAG: type II toxin-antitoxin system VapC family toxin [Candidatus Bathyarchaeota archaeon]|nr:type II toxin-antitoxin system VapC family toxin [Candidatus Bathyarchaeota archaeon]